MEKRDIHLERVALAREIERNRLQMEIAWLKAEGLDGAVQSAKENLDNARTRYFTRKKKVG